MAENVKQQTILIVDDEEPNRKLLKALLESSGYHTATAANGREAIERAREISPDLIFLDIMMPEMDGFEACRILKAGPELKHIPVVLVTALADKESRIRGLKSGADDFLAKPVDPTEVVIKTANLLKIKRYEDALKRQNEALEETVRSRTADLRSEMEERRFVEKENRILFNKISTAKREWETSIDSIEDLIVLVDAAGRIKRCNRSFQQFLAMAYTALLGQPWEALFHGLADDSAALTTETDDQHFSARGRRFNMKAFLFKDVDESKGRIFTIRDVTELSAMTRALELQHRELATAYNDLKVAQSQIIQQEKMASIGQLAAGVAHEINNPTGFIMSNLGSLQKYVDRLTEFILVQSEALAGLPPEHAEAVAKQRTSLKVDFIIEDLRSLVKESLDGADRIKKIVQDLKSFSRVDEAEMKMADINAGIESTINIVWNELKYKATLKKEYGDLPRTKCNPGQLNQVFMNMLVNAAHSIEKQGEIRIRTWAEDNAIKVSIADTGAGIQKDKISRIFEPFFTTKEAGKGTGLGLSIAYDIIKKHQGAISVESEVGKGTTFVVTIPIVSRAETSA